MHEFEIVSVHRTEDGTIDKFELDTGDVVSYEEMIELVSEGKVNGFTTRIQNGVVDICPAYDDNPATFEDIPDMTDVE